MMSRCAAVVVALGVVDASTPFAAELHALDGDDVCRSLGAIEMPECSVSLLQTRVEKMRKSPITVEAVDGSDQASLAMTEMKDAITDLFSSDSENQEMGAPHNSKMTLKSAAVDKASHALDTVKQVFSKLLAQEENRVHDEEQDSKKHQHGSSKDGHGSKTNQQDSKKDDDVSFTQQNNQVGHLSTFDSAEAEDFWHDAKSNAEAQPTAEFSDDFWGDDYLKKATNVGSVDSKKSALLNTQVASSGFPHWSDEDEEIAANEEAYATSDTQVVKTITGSSIAQNSKSVQEILGDVLLSPDDQEMFTLPKAKSTDDKPEVALESVESAVVLNSSWPWSQRAQQNVTSEKPEKLENLNVTSEKLNVTSEKPNVTSEKVITKVSLNDTKTNNTVSASAKASVNSTSVATHGVMSNVSQTTHKSVNSSQDEPSKIGLNRTEDQSFKTNVTNKSVLMSETANHSVSAPLVKITQNMTSELKPVQSAKNGTEGVLQTS